MPTPAPAARATAPQDLPADAATLYPEGDGFFARRARARRAKLLDRIAPVLRTALAPGETIRYAARGTRVFFREYFFAGAAAQYHNMVALVLTDRRLLLVQLDRRGRAGDMKHALALGVVRGAGRSFVAGWRIRLADGSSLAFGALRRADRRRLEALLPASTGPKAAEPSLVHLCPACLRPVPGGPGTAACPQPDCRIPLRDPRRAARLSALVPGLGDLYLRHHLFGALEFLGSMLALGLGIGFALSAVADPEPAALLAAGVVLLFAVALPRAIDYRLTLHMGRKGLVPLALVPAPGAQARNLPSYPRWSPLLFAAGIALAAVFPLAMADDARHDAAVRAAGRLAAEGRLDDAMARWDALVAAGGASEERRVRFALALLEAGDLVGADAVRVTFGGTPVAEDLARRWNAGSALHASAQAEFRAGVEALLEGDLERANPRLDAAVAVFRRVKRPHLPASRPEVDAHLAMKLLAEPLGGEALRAAAPFVTGAEGAPAAEAAIVRAAYDSAAGARSAASAGLAAVDLSAAPPEFRLLALEARARLADDPADREAIREAAGALPREALGEEDAARLDALLAPGR